MWSRGRSPDLMNAADMRPSAQATGTQLRRGISQHGPRFAPGYSSQRHGFISVAFLVRETHDLSCGHFWTSRKFVPHPCHQRSSGTNSSILKPQQPQSMGNQYQPLPATIILARCTTYFRLTERASNFHTVPDSVRTRKGQSNSSSSTLTALLRGTTGHRQPVIHQNLGFVQTSICQAGIFDFGWELSSHV